MAAAISAQFTSTMFNWPRRHHPTVNSSESPGRKKAQQQTGLGNTTPQSARIQASGKQRAQQLDEPLGLVSDRRNR